MDSYEQLLNGEETQNFLIQLREKTGLNFCDYATSSAARRLLRIKKHFRVADYQELLDRLVKDPAMRIEFLDLFTVNVTEMFRDPTFYKTLIPIVESAIERLPGVKPLHVWHPACSSGEEVLSLAIALNNRRILSKVRFIGTDINERMLERATRKLIKGRLLDEYNKAFTQATGDTDGIQRFFREFNKHDWQLREDVPLFARYDFQDLTTLEWPGKGPFDLIVCRNVMIYFNLQLQNEVLTFLIDKLHLGGILALGHKESIAFCDDARRLEALDNDARIFRKIR